jgi:ABC-type nitrate/sulfonate/bicarbonate transport system substrate-binding protein
VTQPERDYQSLVAGVRRLLAEEYAPAYRRYLAALEEADDVALAEAAERLSAAADRAEDLWTASFATRAVELDSSVLVNEAAGAMAMLSDLWNDLAEAHQHKLRHGGA